jgi:CheY-like chemotaxis protein
MLMHVDVYLVQNNLAGREQIQEAIDYQRTHGGRLESHLFRFGYVSESDLVTALSEQHDCPGIRLSGLDIPASTLDLLPADMAFRHRVLPFYHDRSTATVKVACADPSQRSLREDLAESMPDHKVELHVALESALGLAILKHYRQPLAEPTEPEPTVQLENPEIKLEPADEEECRLLLLDTAEGDVPTLGQILQYQGYLVTVVRTVDDFVESIARHKPHIRVLQVPGDRSEVRAVVRQLSESGESLADRPTFLIIDHPEKQEIGDLLREGFVDVISSDNVLDLMMIKLRQTRARICREHHDRREFVKRLGTHGSLDDMNVIDILQALGPTTKTARLSVTGEGHQLAICLNRGQITWAECEGAVGAEAVYCALGWKRGIWSLDPLTLDELPEPNVTHTNEAILLEGCRRLDQGIRDTSLLPVDHLLSALDRLG